MVRLALRIVTVAFAVIGLGTVATWILPLLQGARSAPDNLTVAASPDGKFKAALASWNGGGAIAPFCYDNVFVVPDAAPNEFVADEKYLVFAAECVSSFKSPELSWLGPRTLLIKFWTSEAKTAPARFRLRRVAVDGLVNVEFEIGH